MRGSTFRRLSVETWPDFERLFGDRGACGGCWCMYWRLPRRDFETQKGAANRQAMRKLVESGAVPGILAYVDGEPAGWCSIAPREEFSRLAGARTLRPIDNLRVWSLVCLFVERRFRRQGLSVELIRAACEYVQSRGGVLVEGYPLVPKKEAVPDAFAWTGLPSAFDQAGFTVVARPSDARLIVRRELP